MQMCFCYLCPYDEEEEEKKRNKSLCAASGVLSDVVIFSDCPSGSITDEVLVKGQ